MCWFGTALIDYLVIWSYVRSGQFGVVDFFKKLIFFSNLLFPLEKSGGQEFSSRIRISSWRSSKMSDSKSQGQALFLRKKYSSSHFLKKCLTLRLRIGHFGASPGRYLDFRRKFLPPGKLCCRDRSRPVSSSEAGSFGSWKHRYGAEPGSVLIDVNAILKEYQDGTPPVIFHSPAP